MHFAMEIGLYTVLFIAVTTKENNTIKWIKRFSGIKGEIIG